MHNYGYPDYEADHELYPPLRSPWTTEEQEEPRKDKRNSESKSDRKEDGSLWEEDTPEIQVPRPARLSPRKPSSDIVREQQTAERLVSVRISSPREDGSRVRDVLE